MKLLRRFTVALLSGIIFYYILLLPAFAQGNFIKKNISKVLFKRSWFGFYLSRYNAEKGKPVRQSGAYLMSASSVAGIEAGGNYFINFNKDYSLIVGAHVGFSGRNFKLFIPKSDFTPNLQDDIRFPRTPHQRL